MPSHYLKYFGKIIWSQKGVTSDIDTKPILLGLQEASEDSYLHVERHLGVHQGLVLVHLVVQLVQQPLDLVVLGRKLKYVFEIN